MSSFRELSFAIFFLLMPFNGANAMKPAAFEPIDSTDEKSGFRIVSVPPKRHLSEDLPEKTEVFDPKGKLFWSIPELIGRHKFDLSPDGRTLILSGDYWFGSQMNLGRDEVMARVFTMGQKTKEILFSSLYAKPARELIKEYKIPEKGGGWVTRYEFASEIKVDWVKRTMSFTLRDGTSKSFGF